MSNISLAMIVKNEEKFLGRCLESVKKLVDEIAVVDTGSTDNTVEIARSFGAKIYSFAWTDDFAEARNYSLSVCSCDWVLILDADETIDALDLPLIKNACVEQSIDAYSMVHRHYLPDGHQTLADMPPKKNRSKYSEGRQYEHYSDHPVIRLARRFDGLRFDNKVHETLDLSLKKHNKIVVDLNAVIHHYGKLQMGREVTKEDYYLKLALEQAKVQSQDKWSHFNVLQQALGAKKYDIAVQAAQDALALGLELPFVRWGLGAALQEMDRQNEAIEQFDIILKDDPRHIAAMTKKAISTAVLGDLEAARGMFQRAIEINPEYSPTYCHMATVETAMGLLAQARKTVTRGLNVSPNEPQLHDALIKVGVAAQNHPQAAMDALAAIVACPKGGDGRWHLYLASFLAEGGEKQRARAVLREGLAAFPENEELRTMDRELA